MKLQFLGTSAGEGYPALWCDCVHCRYAREHGQKNIRLNSCAVLDADTFIDMNATCFSAAQTYGADLLHRNKLFVTHDHQDHFFPQHLVWRSQAFDSRHGMPTEPVENVEAWNDVMGPRFSPIPFLHIYGHPTILDAIAAHPRLNPDTMAEKQQMDFTALTPGQTVQADGLRVTAVRSNHGTPGTVFNYIFERGGKTLLYALDCGGYDGQMLELIRQYRYDCVVMEGTFGKHRTDFDFHMNQRGNLRMLAFFNEHRLWTGRPNLWLSHMAPHWTPPHDLYAKEMAEYGIGVAYDGLILTIQLFDRVVRRIAKGDAYEGKFNAHAGDVFAAVHIAADPVSRHMLLYRLSGRKGAGDHPRYGIAERNGAVHRRGAGGRRGKRADAGQ